MKYAFALILAITLAACTVTEEPIVAPEPPEVVTPAPDPVPDPVVEYAPVGTCPIEAELIELVPSPDRPAIVRVRLGSPCEDGDLVPFLYREDLLWNDTFVNIIDGALVAGGSLHGPSEVNLAVPWNERDRRFEIVDVRTGEVIVSFQNYRIRSPR